MSAYKMQSAVTRGSYSTVDLVHSGWRQNSTGTSLQWLLLDYASQLAVCDQTVLYNLPIVVMHCLLITAPASQLGTSKTCLTTSSILSLSQSRMAVLFILLHWQRYWGVELIVTAPRAYPGGHGLTVTFTVSCT